MTATIDSNTISIMVNNTVEDIDKAMQILMTPVSYTHLTLPTTPYV